MVQAVSTPRLSSYNMSDLSSWVSSISRQMNIVLFILDIYPYTTALRFSFLHRSSSWSIDVFSYPNECVTTPLGKYSHIDLNMENIDIFKYIIRKNWSSLSSAIFVTTIVTWNVLAFLGISDGIVLPSRIITEFLSRDTTYGSCRTCCARYFFHHLAMLYAFLSRRYRECINGSKWRPHHALHCLELRYWSRFILLLHGSWPVASCWRGKQKTPCLMLHDDRARWLWNT